MQTKFEYGVEIMLKRLHTISELTGHQEPQPLLPDAPPVSDYPISSMHPQYLHVPIVS